MQQAMPYYHLWLVWSTIFFHIIS